MAAAYALVQLDDDEQARQSLIDGLARVTDFGVAQTIFTDQQTFSGSLKGKLRYMAPERLRFEKIDARVDLFSLGVVLYEMLTGHPPFTGPEVESIVRQHLTVDPPPVTQVRTAVPTQVEGALTWAMAKSPADRDPTASEFGAALGQSTVAAQAGPVSMPRRPSSRARVVTGSLAAIAALVLLVWAGLWFGRPVPVTEASRRVIVLPYDNQTGDPDLDPIGRMVAEEITEGLLNRVEVAIRAYDPCLSCATHAMGQMPLTIELVDHDGTVLDTRSRGQG